MLFLSSVILLSISSIYESYFIKKKINFAVGMYSMKFLIKFGGFPVALEMKPLTPRVEKLHVCLFVL